MAWDSYRLRVCAVNGSNPARSEPGVVKRAGGSDRPSVPPISPTGSGGGPAPSLRIEFPPELPISARSGEIVDALVRHPVVIVAGETGSGKSTQIPKLCLAAGRGRSGRIACTQPRRVAALSLSRRLAEEMGVEWGREVGCKVRFNDQTSRATCVKFLTDGMLLAEAQGDPLLREYDTIVIDEAHERSLNIDFLLGHLRQLRANRPDLKVVITSATIDTATFSRSFDDAPVITVEGRMFPVEVVYAPLDQLGSDAAEGDESDARAEALHYVDGAAESVERIAQERGGGDILVFMPSERDIRETCEILAGRLPRWDIVPLFGRLTNDEQRRIFAPGARRRVVVATNIAETSLTIPGIRFVVDTGLARISRYAPRGRTRRLPIEPISRSSADQRKGRCGRVAEGVCIRLYSEEDYLSRPAFTPPEIQRANLADVILRLKAHSLGDMDTFPFIEPPAAKAVRAGYQLLEELGAMAPGPGHELTALGRDLARLPVDPTAGRMILQAIQERAVREVLVIAAGLSIQDPRERPQEKRAQADAAHRKFVHPDSDFLTLLNIWDAFHSNLESLSQSRLRAFCRGHHLSYTRMREWRDVHAQIEEVVRSTSSAALSSVFDGLKPGAERLTGFGSPAYRAVHRSVLAGLLGNIARLDEEDGGYRAAQDRRVVLFPGSSLYRREAPAKPAGISSERRKRPDASPRWIMAAEIVETTRLFARTCARLDPTWALDIGAHLIQASYSDPFWDAGAGRVMVKRKSRLYGLEIETRSVSYGPVDPARATDIFIREGLVNDTITWPFEFLAHNRRVREQQASNLARLRSAGYLGLDEAVARFYASRLPEVSSVGELVKLVRTRQGADPRFLFMTPEDLGGEAEQAPDEGHFPAAVPIENRALPLHYAYRPGQADDGVTLTVKPGEAAALTAADLDWAVPGHLEEKVEHYLRALPKEHRRMFVPLAEQARVLARALLAARPARPRTETLEAALAALIREERHLTVDPAAWSAKPLPERLRVRVRVVDDRGDEVASGREWAQVQAALAQAERVGALQLQRDDPSAWGQARARFELGPRLGWGFGEWTERVVVSERAGLPVYAYQALTAEAGGVALRLYRTPEEAAAAQAGGQAALLDAALRNDLACLRRDLRELGSLGADLAMLGGSAGLAEDAFATLRSWIIDREIRPASATGFEAAVARARADLRGLVPRIVALVGAIARQRIELLAEKHPFPGLAADLERLVPPGFLRTTPYPQLEHLPRYLKAMAIRVARRRQNPARDDERARELAPLAAAARSRPGTFSWLVEEYRVSLFAQELGTAVPVSKVKLERMLAGGADSAAAAAGEAPAPAPANARPLERPAKLKNLKALDNIFLR